MITKAEKLAFIVAECNERRFHVDTMDFFEDNDAIFQSLSPSGEGLVDGIFRTFAYIEKREQEQKDRCVDDCVSRGECV